MFGYIDIETICSISVIEKLKKLLIDSEGNEILFGAKLHKNNYEISSVEALVFGSINKVIVDKEKISIFDIIIHNHPTSDLQPSDEDMQVASYCMDNGIGFAIIDNLCSKMYVVISPIEVTKKKKVSKNLVIHYFNGEKGYIKDKIPHYKYRDEQSKLAQTITEIINNDSIGFIEAQTGIGKSLAYIIPGILLINANKTKIVISTNTINLQQQLFYKDIPAAIDIVNKKVTYSLIMGRRNYLCRLRFKQFIAAAQSNLFDDDDEIDAEILIKWVESTQTGTNNDLSFVVKERIWDEICANIFLCMKAGCSYFSQCFYYGARKKIIESDIIVINHYLYLMNEILVEGDVIPFHNTIIFDEAHNLVDVYDKLATETVSFTQLIYQLNRFYSHSSKTKGFLSFYEKQLEMEADLFVATGSHIADCKHLITSVIAALNKSNRLIDDMFNEFKQARKVVIQRKEIKNTTIFNDLVSVCNPLIHDLSLLTFKFNTIIQCFTDNAESIQKKDNCEQLLFIQKIFEQIYIIISLSTKIINDFISEDNLERKVLWIELKSDVSFHYYDMSKTEAFFEKLSNKVKSSVFISATLAINNTFSYYKEQMKILDNPNKHFVEATFNSPFDYKSNARIYIPTDCKNPTDIDYNIQILPHITDIVSYSQGRALILTTSFTDINYFASNLRDSLPMLQILSQGGKNSSNKLLQLFKSQPKTVLIATMSFWEGIDVPGEALSVLIITRIPFKVPTTPIFQAKSEVYESMGKSAFMHLALPYAALKLKQGFGRLIRKEDDRGVCFIFDNRIVTKQYGKIIGNSLPNAPIISLSMSEILKLYKDFL